MNCKIQEEFERLDREFSGSISGNGEVSVLYAQLALETRRAMMRHKDRCHICNAISQASNLLACLV